MTKFKPYRGHTIIRTMNNFHLTMHAFKGGKEVAFAPSRRELEIAIDRLCNGKESVTGASAATAAVTPCASTELSMAGDMKAGTAKRSS